MSYNINDLNNALSEVRYQIFSFKEWAEERLKKLEAVSGKLIPKAEELFNKMIELFNTGKSEEARNVEEEYDDLEEKIDSVTGEINCIEDLLNELENLNFGKYVLKGFDEDLNDSLVKGE